MIDMSGQLLIPLPFGETLELIRVIEQGFQLVVHCRDQCLDLADRTLADPLRCFRR